MLHVCLLMVGCETSQPKLVSLDNVKVMGPLTSGNELDVKPKIVSQELPEYPEELKRERLDAIVEVSFIITKEGTTREIQVDTKNNRIFANLAKNTISTWEYTPAIKDGEPVECLVSLDFVFACHTSLAVLELGTREYNQDTQRANVQDFRVKESAIRRGY